MPSLFSQLPGELTVGYVAGIIAACVAVIHLFCPAALAYLLAGILRDTETASTWTAASASLASSIWPSVLRTDSANGQHVRTVIVIVCKALPLLVLLCGITGIVTPLGLDVELTSLTETSMSFSYAPDESAYGMGTSPRGRFVATRICMREHLGSPALATCPYSDSEVVYEDDPDGQDFAVRLPKGYNTAIPQEAREIFSSGTGNSTVSNFFDIEWRQQSIRISPELDRAELAAGLFRSLDSFILENNFKIVEGLIIDAKAGGIGFRNHTIPIGGGLEYGATWEEDLLFIEPSTSCVNTNLTFDFETAPFRNTSAGGNIENLVLTDRGGFSRINSTLPDLNLGDGQTHPDLMGRAYKAAWLNNVFTMLYLNITNENDKPVQGMKPFAYLDSVVGKTFGLPRGNSDSYEGLQLSADFGNYLHLSGSGSKGVLSGPNYTNPFNISDVDFANVNFACSGTGGGDLANSSNIYVGCGLLRGAPNRTDDGPGLIFESGSRWTSPLYACASSVRATVKTVRFSLNGTALDGLSVLSITPKAYTGEADLPIWGLENWGFRMNNYYPLWGLLSPEYQSRTNVTAIRARQFYLPGYSTGPTAPRLDVAGRHMVDNNAAADFAQRVMNTVFRDVTGAWPFDLRGTSSMAIFRRWQLLSENPALASEIINLMWTDIAASAVVGTRSVLGSSTGGSPSNAANILVRPRASRITYDFRFGIPAALLLVCVGSIVLAALFCTCCCGRRAGFKILRWRIEQLSVGRVFTTFLYPEESSLAMSAEQWRKTNGFKKITVSTVAKRGDDEEEYTPAMNGERGGHVGDTYTLIEGHGGKP